MTTRRPPYPLVRLGRGFEVSRSGSPAWQRRRPAKRAQEHARLEVASPAAPVRPRGPSGPERLPADLRAAGVPAGLLRIKRWRTKLGRRGQQGRRCPTTTDSNHPLPVADTRLAPTFAATRPNETGGTDITDVPTAEGWRSLAGITALSPCEVGGHAMAARMTTDLVSRALVGAVWAKRPRPGLIHHSDRGSQYWAQAYHARVKQFGLIASMSRRGNGYDNAPMERCWGPLKHELVPPQREATREQARREITESIEVFSNRQRRHSRLGNRSPAVVAQQWARQQPAA